jgi:hypothetical protein
MQSSLALNCKSYTSDERCSAQKHGDRSVGESAYHIYVVVRIESTVESTAVLNCLINYAAM